MLASIIPVGFYTQIAFLIIWGSQTSNVKGDLKSHGITWTHFLHFTDEKPQAEVGVSLRGTQERAESGRKPSSETTSHDLCPEVHRPLHLPLNNHTKPIGSGP